MKVIFSLALLLSFAAIAAGQCPESVTLRGVRLGQTFEQVAAVQVVTAENKIVFNDAAYNLFFTNRKLSKISITYISSEFKTPGEFAAAFSDALGLPVDQWKPGDKETSLKCKTFSVALSPGPYVATAVIETVKPSKFIP